MGVTLRVTPQTSAMRWANYMIALRKLAPSFMARLRRLRSNLMNPRQLWMENLLAWFSIKTMMRTRAMKELKDGSKLLHLRVFLSKPYVWLSNVETWEPPSTSLSTSMTVLLIQGVNSLDFSFNNKFEEYNTSRSSRMYKSTYTSCHQFLLLRRRE